MAGMPPSGLGPGRPLPGGRDDRRDAEREARRIATRLAAAQRRLGLTQPTLPVTPLATIEDLPQAAPAADPGLRHTFRRLGRLRRPRRTR